MSSMSVEANHPFAESVPPLGAEIRTACGGESTFAADTPWVWYQGRRVYFCTQECKRIFETDVEHSCLFEKSDR